MQPRPDDLLPVLEAAALVDRSLTTLRGWVRSGELTGYRESESPNGRLLVSRSELLAFAAVSGLSPTPARRGAPPPLPLPPPVAPSPTDTRLLEELLVSHRATLAALEARCSALQSMADAWQGRALAAEAEATALRELLRAEQGRSLWSRLLGTSKPSSLTGD